MAEVTVKVGNLEVVAAITKGSVKSMGLKVNDSVTIAVKATVISIDRTCKFIAKDAADTISEEPCSATPE